MEGGEDDERDRGHGQDADRDINDARCSGLSRRPIGVLLAAPHSTDFMGEVGKCGLGPRLFACGVLGCASAARGC